MPLIFGEKMRDALRAQGTPVEWQVYSDEAHGFLLEKNRTIFTAASRGSSSVSLLPTDVTE